jgi:hypothetical protein
MVQALTMLLGMGLASTLGDSIGIVSVLDIAAGCDFFAGVLAFLVVRYMSQQKQPQELEYAVASEACVERKAAL